MRALCSQVVGEERLLADAEFDHNTPTANAPSEMGYISVAQATQIGSSTSQLDSP